MRIQYATALVLILACRGIAQGQDKRSKAELDADEVVSKILKDAFPPPLNGRIQLTIEKTSPLTILPNKESKKPGGARLTFDVVVKNIGDKEFTFTPGNVDVRILDSKGVELPLDRFDWNSNVHGDTGEYPVKTSERKWKPITLVFVDNEINAQSKYFVVAQYAVTYKEPAVRYDYVTGMRAVDMKDATEAKEEKRK